MTLRGLMSKTQTNLHTGHKRFGPTQRHRLRPQLNPKAQRKACGKTNISFIEQRNTQHTTHNTLNRRTRHTIHTQHHNVGGVVLRHNRARVEQTFASLKRAQHAGRLLKAQFRAGRRETLSTDTSDSSLLKNSVNYRNKYASTQFICVTIA